MCARFEHVHEQLIPTMEARHLTLWERRCWSFHVCSVGAFLRLVASDWPNLRLFSADWSFQGANFSIEVKTCENERLHDFFSHWPWIYSPHWRIVPKRSFLVEWSPNAWFFVPKSSFEWLVLTMIHPWTLRPNFGDQRSLGFLRIYF